MFSPTTEQLAMQSCPCSVPLLNNAPSEPVRRPSNTRDRRTRGPPSSCVITSCTDKRSPPSAARLVLSHASALRHEGVDSPIPSTILLSVRLGDSNTRARAVPLQPYIAPAPIIFDPTKQVLPGNMRLVSDL